MVFVEGAVVVVFDDGMIAEVLSHSMQTVDSVDVVGSLIDALAVNRHQN